VEGEAVTDFYKRPACRTTSVNNRLDVFVGKRSEKDVADDGLVESQPHCAAAVRNVWSNRAQ